MSAATSATIIEHQIPSSPKIKGNSNTAPTSKIKVLMKEMTAEIKPLLRAVKNPDPKILNPQSRKDTA